MAQRAADLPQPPNLPSGNEEDKELALSFKRGEDGAYQAIHDRYSARVHGVCRRMLGHDDAQEAAQETFLRVYQALGRFNGRYQLGPWITRIATNVCLDHLRSKARRPSHPVPNEILMLDEAVTEGDSEPERMVIADSESRRVRRILATLPPMHRAAIVLRDFEGLSYEEVSVALQITECQAKALIHRARQNFKRSWTKSLSALLPWRLIDKMRGLDTATREHAAEVATMTQSVTSCTSMLQQCGQYVGQHVATVVTAAIVGTAAGAASQAATATQPARPEETSSRAGSGEAPGASSPVSKVLSQAVSPEAKGAPAGKEPRPQEEVVPSPASSPEPEATPAAPPTPAPDPTPEEPSPEPVPPAPQPSETPRTAPQPFAPAVGFDYGRPLTGRAPRSHSATVSCTSDLLEQRLETVIEDDDSSTTYPALLQLNWEAAGSGRLSLEFTVWKNGHEIYYSGLGNLVGGSYPDGQRKLEFVGNYGTLNEQAKTMDLPSSGRFTAGLTLDCAALSVITESVVLGA